MFPKNETKYVVAIAGPSGAGKTVLADALVSQNENFYKLHQMTTRPPRHNKDEYIFVPPSVLEIFDKEGLVTCTTSFNSNFYGTLIEKTGFKFSIVVVSAEGMRSLYEDKEKFASVLDANIEILPIYLSYNVSEETLAARKRSRSPEFVLNEIHELSELTNVEGFEWFMQFENGDDFTDSSLFEKAFFEKLNKISPSAMREELLRQLQNPDLPLDVLLKMQLCLQSDKSVALSGELTDLFEPPAEKETEEATTPTSIEETLLVAEEVLDQDPLEDKDVEKEAFFKQVAESLDTEKTEEKPTEPLVEEEVEKLTSFNQLGMIRISQIFGRNFIDYIGTSGNNTTASLLSQDQIENVAFTFLIQALNFDKDTLAANAGMFRVSHEDTSPNDPKQGIRSYTIEVLLNDSLTPVFMFKFNKELKQISM